MKLKRVVFKCMGRKCKHKLVLDHMPTEQPLCEKCYMPMELIEVKAVGGL